MDERRKKILFAIGFVIVSAGLGWLIYWVFFRTSPVPESLDVADQVPTGSLPQAQEGAQLGTDGYEFFDSDGLDTADFVEQPEQANGQTQGNLTILTDQIARVVSPTPSNDGFRYYDPSSGLFYRVGDDGVPALLSDRRFYSVDQVSWGNTSNKAVITYPDGSNILYDFSNQQQVTLPKHWEDFSFSPNDDKIAAKSIGNNERNRYLVVANPDGTNPQPVEELGQNQDKVDVSWSPNNQIIAFAYTGDPIGFDRQAIVMVGQHHENFKQLIVEGRGFVPSWSPSGKNLLYSVYDASNGYRPTLWVSGAVGDSINANRRQLNIQTWADKCTWQSETVIYCAVPAALPEGAGLQRELVSQLQDTIYRIDLQSGQSVDIGQPQGAAPIEQLQVSPSGDALYFSRQDSGQFFRYQL